MAPMQRLGAVLVVAIVSIGSLVSLVGPASADAPRSPKQQEADKLFAEGRELLTKNDYKGACAKFELAATADPTAAGTMLNLGLCYEQLGKTHTALNWFRRAQTQASEAGLPDHEDAAKKHTADLITKVPVISITFGGAGAADPHVRIDSEDISAADLAHVEVDPGDHVIEVRASHRKLSRGHITVAPRDPAVAEAVEVKIALEEGEPTVVVDKGRQRRFVGVGLGVVALGAWTFDFFYGISKSRRYHCAIDPVPSTDCNTATDPNDSTKKFNPVAANTNYANDRVKDLQYKGTAVFIVGAAALAAGAYLFFTAPGKVTVDQVGGERVSVAPYLAPSQVGLAITGGF